MNKLKQFFSTKGFYIALCTGIFAFAALMVVQDYKAAKEDLNKEQAIDLNEPSDELVENDTDGNVADMADNGAVTETPVKEAEIVNSDSAIPQTEESTEEVAQESTEAVEETVPTNSDTANPAVELVFDEEQSLVWPLVGNVILPYSMDTTVYFQTLDAYKCNPGILIEAQEGMDVVSASDGIVSEITETKEYGTVVKVNMGSGYEAIYGQLMNVTVSVGENVSMSQSIGEVAPVSAYYTEEGENLYFAITKDGQPIDPMTLIQ